MKIKLLLLALLCSGVTQGQIFRSVELNDVPGSRNEDCKLVGASADGRTLLLTTGTNQGLWRMDTATGEREQITDVMGAGYQPVMSNDGEHVLYRKSEFDASHRRVTSLHLQSLDDKKVECVIAPTRNMQGYRFVERTAMAVADNQSVRKRIAGKRIGEDIPVVSVRDLQLMITRNGKTIQLSPNGTDVSYIWPSLSPDGKRILYYVSEEGAYVCNLDGGDVQFISHDCRAPQWYDDHTIVGMMDVDNGEQVTASCLFAYTLEGKCQRLTPSSSMTMYPQCCAAQSRIYCCTYQGELKQISVEK